MKMDRKARRRYTRLGLAVLFLSGGRAISAQTANRAFGPDFLNTLGVGSRSIGMGGAFSALADDVTATFWNPARLSTIKTHQFMLETRSTLENRSSVTDGVDLSGSHPGSPQLSFIGFVLPLESYRRKRDPDTNTIKTVSRNYYGHIGVSYTLGGYYSLDSNQVNTVLDPIANAPVIDPATNKNAVSTAHYTQRIRSQFLSLTYGNRTDAEIQIGARDSDKKLRIRIGYGAGLVFLTQDQSASNSSAVQYVSNGVLTAAPPTFVEQTNKGTGTGYILGLSAGVGELNSPLYRFAVSYRSPIKIHFDENSANNGTNTGVAFGDEIPGRLALGLAYESKLNGDPLRFAVEEHFFSSANNAVISYSDPAGGMDQVQKQQDQRAAVANFHIGVEFEPRYSHLRYLFGKGNTVRLGFYTNEGAARQYTRYTNVYTLGYSLQSRDSRGNLIASLEPTAEIIGVNGAVVWTVSGLFRF